MVATGSLRMSVLPLWVIVTALMITMMSLLLLAMTLVPETIGGVRRANLYVVGAIMAVEVACVVWTLQSLVVPRLKWLSRLLMEDPVVVAGDPFCMAYLRLQPMFGASELVHLQLAVEQLYLGLASLRCSQGAVPFVRNGANAAAAASMHPGLWDDRTRLVSFASAADAVATAVDDRANYELVNPNPNSFSMDDYLLSRRYEYKKKRLSLMELPHEVGLRASQKLRGLLSNTLLPASAAGSPTIEADCFTACSSAEERAGASPPQESSLTQCLSVHSLHSEPLLVGEEEDLRQGDEDDATGPSPGSGGNQELLPILSAEDRAICDPLDDNSNNSFAVLANSLRLDGAIIFQVLKNIRIGRSLSSVSLPVHILESRSLLETLSDMFVAWDLLMPLAWGEVRQPVDRMRVMLCWFFSAYNWRPKGVAKKPYNPILGEVFQCKCPAPPSLLSVPPSREVHAKAQETCSLERTLGCSDSMYFLSEQVCHRPPVSVFYAELPNLIVAEGVYLPHSKLISLNSVASISHSSVLVQFPRTGWSCRFSLPNAFASGMVFGTPRLELGGVVRLEDCHSPAHATVNFRRKEFFGGMYDEVVARISTADGNGIAEEYTGLWHGVICPRGTQHTASVGSKRQRHHSLLSVDDESHAMEPLFDAEAFQRRRGMPCGRPYAYPLRNDNNGHPYQKQSRAVWRDLTTAIRLGDVEAAANAKSLVEEAQRAERRELEVERLAHVPKFFEFLGDGELSHGNEDVLAKQENWRFTARDMLFM
ncbi:putative oxysterol-binding protein [Trypanosoma rangeli]|uniref:Putative oxysterol-binding protein n=1 Tax=Trypanosoma rangeli TaxID=5698 RepID=A0A422N2L6_TRYRA|nr:putative oxysterol-binding protein [Trypanosoma rangeli]RNE99690.1 putative oxysterol-binding protein [Trypanosoma rangeli]|eukprot:RNE99690.1 putative oxysterol-binding protein [Trypanosoma rangeli]